MARRKYYLNGKPADGFTVIEVMLVLVIVGVIMAIVVPRAWRANIDAKYNIVRQSGSEIASWGLTWAERNLNSQPLEEGPGPSTVTSKLIDYLETLKRVYTGNKNDQNWRVVNPPRPDGRHEDLTYAVLDIMPQDKLPRNPFNGISYFADENDGDIEFGPGQLYLSRFEDTFGYYEYYFIYLGTESTSATDWYAGMEDNSANARNGIFMTKLIRN